jgi:mono/diheme cytochrome c family protein
MPSAARLQQGQVAMIQNRFRKRICLAKLPVILAVSIFPAFLAAVPAPAQTAPVTQKQLETLIYSVKGPDLFRAHCAACHGLSGKGNGPMAGALKSRVPDLTVLAKNNNGQFPAARVGKIIAGDPASESHGSREMPVWGPIFHQIEEDRDYGSVRIANLVKYLQSIQQN